jgi:uncharacterized protein YbaR (Trm112 family)
VGEGDVAQLRLELVSADVRVVRVEAGGAQRLHFGKRRGRGAGPAISGCKVQDAHCCSISREMAIDAELLEILACPLCKEEVKLVPLSDARRAAVRDKYRDKFRGEEPVVEQGLQCVKCRRIYPIVSDIPVMLVEEAFDEA